MPRSGGSRARWLAALAASVLGVVAGVVAIARTADAQPSPLHLHWEAPAPCPDESYVRGAIEGLLAGGPTSNVEVDAKAVVDRSPSGKYRVAITTVRDGATGERSIEVASCRSLADATALIIALTVNPARVAANRPPQELGGSDAGSVAPPPVELAVDSGATPDAPASAAAETKKALPPSTATPGRPAERPSEPRAGASRRVGLFASFDGDVGTLPSVGVGVSAGAALVLQSVRLDAYGTYLFAQKDPAPFSGVGLHVSLAAGGGRACFLPRLGPFELGVCAGLEAGGLLASSYGGPTSGRGAVPWLAPVASGRFSWSVARAFHLALEVGAAVPLVRSSLELPGVPLTGLPTDFQSTAVTFRSSPVTGRAWVGPELQF